MKNKTILITGGNAGIGYQTALALAKMEATVYIVARSKDKAEEAVKSIKSESGNEKVDYFLADFNSQKSIRDLAEQVLAKISVLDVLVNNAGGVFPEYKLNQDGLEMTIATNHFAYFLLTNLLLPLIKKAEAGRIVNVASRSHYRGKINFKSFTEPQHFSTMSYYEQSKLANVLFTFELADRLSSTGITVNALHPGVVKTNIGNKDMQWYASLVWSLFSGIGGISVADGAKTSIYLASSPQVKNVTGKYFDRCKPIKPSKLALDKELGKELWRVSEKLCAIK